VCVHMNWLLNQRTETLKRFKLLTKFVFLLFISIITKNPNQTMPCLIFDITKDTVPENLMLKSIWWKHSKSLTLCLFQNQSNIGLHCQGCIKYWVDKNRFYTLTLDKNGSWERFFFYWKMPGVATFRWQEKSRCVL